MVSILVPQFYRNPIVLFLKIGRQAVLSPIGELGALEVEVCTQVFHPVSVPQEIVVQIVQLLDESLRYLHFFKSGCLFHHLVKYTIPNITVFLVGNTLLKDRLVFHPLLEERLNSLLIFGHIPGYGQAHTISQTAVGMHLCDEVAPELAIPITVDGLLGASQAFEPIAGLKVFVVELVHVGLAEHCLILIMGILVSTPRSVHGVLVLFVEGILE